MAGWADGLRVGVRAMPVLFAAGLAVLLAAAVPALGDELHEPSRWALVALIYLAALTCLLRAGRRPEERVAWALFAVAVASYATGFLVWFGWLEDRPEPPWPSLADVFWLAIYPPTYAALALLARRRVVGLPRSVFLDGAIAGLGAAAFVAAFVYEPIFASASGDVLERVVWLGYPVGDMILAGCVVGFTAISGGRPERVWTFLGLGFVAMLAADLIWFDRVVAGEFHFTAASNALWGLMAALYALAAWSRPGKPDPRIAERWPVLAIPAAFTLLSCCLLLVGYFTEVGRVALVLAVLTVLAASARMLLTLREVRTLANTRREALTDDLTGLANRRRFLRELERSVERRREEDGPVAVLLLDLDNFKELNDTLGHFTGDLLLKGIGPRLRRFLRRSDLVARLGGDEFALLLRSADAELARDVAVRMREAVAEPFSLQGLTVSVGASVGIAIADGQADADELLKRADVAMYQAKATGAGQELYEPRRDRHSRARLELAGELRDAIEARQIVLHYQPKYELASGAVSGVEALSRWRHPLRGVLPPSDFLPIAERVSLVRPFTLLVLETAIAQCARWRRDGLDLSVAVNLAPPNLLDLSLPDDVARLLGEHGLPPAALELELTETTVMADPARTGEILARLESLGLGLALDDFGTGYSSLAYLRELPVEALKIDKSFVSGMCRDVDDEAIVSTVVSLAHSLRMRVVAEGVEDAETLERLKALGCDAVQGFHVARPMPVEGLEEWLRDRTEADPVGTGRRRVRLAAM